MREKNDNILFARHWIWYFKLCISMLRFCNKDIRDIFERHNDFDDKN